MTTFTADRLYELLPAVYRIRDAEQGKPLRALIEVIADQIAVVEENLDQLYDDQFVETCAPWVLPYLGDLLGITGLPPRSPRGEPAPLGSRAEVAHTLGWRRRKGTAAVLEQIARDVTGLPARAVEFFSLLAATQYLNHVRPENVALVSVRGAARLEQVNGPFEHLPNKTDITHTADVRRIGSGRGRYNIPNVGIFLWRLRALRLSRSPAVPAAPGDVRRFRFSPLGNDAPLFHRPRTEDEITHLAEPADVSAPISRRAFHDAPGDFYGVESGDDPSILLETPAAAVPIANIVVCDLSAWRVPPAGKVALDPVLGRISFGDDQAAPPLVTFHHGFSANIGGGEYDRRSGTGQDDKPAALLTVANVQPRAGAFTDLTSALAALTTPFTVGKTAVIEIADSGRYEVAGDLTLDTTGRTLILRAADGARPTLVLGGDLRIVGGPNDALVLNGLLVCGSAAAGGGLVADPTNTDGNGVGRLHLRHCTLVPGRALDENGAPLTPDAPSLIVRAANTEVVIEHSITGALRVNRAARPARITNSIVDATRETGVTFAAPDGADFGAPLTVENSTILGKIKTDRLDLASNTIFLSARAPGDDVLTWPGLVVARRRQTGCVRFSYLPPGSLTPRRFRCPPTDDDATIRPVLSASRYGKPAYAQLSQATPDAIRRGADDESEMGAFHDNHLPRREDHLRARLDEYGRFGQETGIFYVT